MQGNKLQTMAKAGYAARGVIYIVIGALAALAAWGSGGETTNTRGALVEIVAAPFGRVLLALVALGLLGYAVWRLVQSLLDADRHGSDAKGLALRVGFAGSGLLHLGLAMFAGKLVIDPVRASTDGSARDEWTTWLMSQPFGHWLVAGVGVGVVGVGVAHVVKATRDDLLHRFAVTAQQARWISPVSRFGLVARAVVFFIVGGFFVVAAVHQDPSRARGLSGALQALEAQSFGWLLLAVVALGLVAFGVFSLVESRYRRIAIGSQVPSSGDVWAAARRV